MGVFRVMRRLFWHLRRPVKQTSTLRIPPEIILLILNYLEPESVLSFALTCRLYYISYFPQSPFQSIESKKTFLTLLEKDIPHLMYCTKCVILHPWGRQWLEPTWKWDIRPRRLCFITSFAPSYDIARLYYYHVRLVMNRHLYGDAHGFPVQILNRDGEQPSYSTGVHVKYSWRARIVDDELFLLMELTVYYPTGDMNDPERFFRFHGGEICYHRTVWGKPRSKPNDSPSISFCRSEAKYHKTLPPKFLANMELDTILSCPVCLTDAQIKVNWCYKRKQWSVTVITWKQFGKCRSPDDPQWTSLTCWHTDSGDHRAQEHPPGAVRHRWSKGDDEVLGMEGYFIDPPWFQDV